MENDDKMIHYFNFIVYNVIPCNKLYKKFLFNEIRYPRNKIFEDVYTTHKLIDKANKVVVSPDCKYYCLQRSGSITKKLFTLEQFERVEASIDRYNYVVEKYPKLEIMCRKYIFTDLLACVSKAVMDSAIDTYMKEMQTIVQKVKKYSMYDCGLSEQHQTELKLIFDNIRKYIIGLKIYSRLGRNL